MVQLAFAVICCSLPTYRPLLPKGTRLVVKLRTYYDSAASLVGRKLTLSNLQTKPTGCSDSYSGNTVRPRYNHYNNFDGGEVDTVGLTHAAGVSDPEDRFVAGTDYPMNAINVRRDVEMV